MRRTFIVAAIVVWFATPSSVPLLAADADGKALFEKSCAGCHGADGTGNPAMAKIIGEKGLNITTKETQQKSDEQLLKIIAEGSGKMPPSKLSKDEQKRALGHAKSLAK